MDWIIESKEWIFSGIGGVILLLFAEWFRRRGAAKESGSIPAPAPVQQVVNTINLSNNNGSASPPAAPPPSEQTEISHEVRVQRVKDATRILFVDDDVKFKVVKILKNAGWPQTSLVKDLSSLSDPMVVGADVVFVDIQGVGASLGFKDEGLGLAEALKEKYPAKKIVIYSAEPKGAMFHKALRKADASIEKNADPYEFERMIAGFVGII